MNTPSNTASESLSDSPVIALAAVTRPFYWSVRRELWENRYLYIAPLVVAAILLFGFTIGAIWYNTRTESALVLMPWDDLMKPYSFATGVIALNTFVVGVVYCLGALQGERRDRTILFWKSLPVSDLTTVLAKASIPLIVLPLISFSIIVALHLMMMLLSTAAFMLSGVDAATLWIKLPLFWVALLPRGLIVLTLLHAPIYGWLLLVSGWARRATFLWALLPPVALSLVEKIAFNTSYFASLLNEHLQQSFTEAFAYQVKDIHGIDDLFQFDPVKFLSSPGLWLGLAATAIFLAAAVWLRRNREPF